MKLIKEATPWSTQHKMDTACNDFISATITQALWGKHPVTIYRENSPHGANMTVPLTVKLLEDKEGQVTTETAITLADIEFLTEYTYNRDTVGGDEDKVHERTENGISKHNYYPYIRNNITVCFL